MSCPTFLSCVLRTEVECPSNESRRSEIHLQWERFSSGPMDNIHLVSATVLNQVEINTYISTGATGVAYN